MINGWVVKPDIKEPLPPQWGLATLFKAGLMEVTIFCQYEQKLCESATTVFFKDVSGKTPQEQCCSQGGIKGYSPSQMCPAVLMGPLTEEVEES